VHRPVRAPVLTEFTCAVKWIDDPDPRSTQALLVVGSFFGEHGIVGTLFRQQSDDQVVGQPIAAIPKALGVVEPHLGAECEQRLSGFDGRVAREFMV
jgi:hypothetical protein